MPQHEGETGRGRKPEGKKEGEYVVWGFLRQIALQGRLYSTHALLSYSKLRALLGLQAYVICLCVQHACPAALASA